MAKIPDKVGGKIMDKDMKKKMMEKFKKKMAEKAMTSREYEQLFQEIAGTYNTDREKFEAMREEFEERVLVFSNPRREKWKQEHRNEVEGNDEFERIVRWDYDYTYLSKLSPLNEGKKITDNNPLFNLASIEELDISTESEPFVKYSGTQGSPEMFITWNMPEAKDATGNMFGDMLDIGGDVMKMRMDEVMPGAVSPDREEDLVKLREEITEKAKELGFGVVGFTKVDRRYLAEGRDDYAPYQNIIILGMEMDKEGIEAAPVYDKLVPTYQTYKDSGREVLVLAEFIRSKGWKAHPRVSLDGGVKLVPHGVNAGIINFGTSNNSISREFGTRMRLCCITTEAELPMDSPRDLNVEEFCSRCRMCQKSCPVKAIPKEAIRHRGSYRRKVRDVKCYTSMMGTRKTCAICIKVCPFSKFGYDKCMDSLPDYYRYNTMD